MPGPGSPLGRAPPHTWRQISSAGRGRDSALGSLGALWPSLERCWWGSVLTLFTFYLFEYRDHSHYSHQELECIVYPRPASHHRAAITDLIITISLTNGGCSLAKLIETNWFPVHQKHPASGSSERRGECRGAVVCFGGRVPSVGRVVFVLVACLILPSILYPCLTGIM